jgi:hypothetical protein
MSQITHDTDAVRSGTAGPLIQKVCLVVVVAIGFGLSAIWACFLVSELITLAQAAI